MGKLWRGLGWTAAFLIVIGLFLRVAFFDAWVVPDEPKMSAAVAPSMAGGDLMLYMRRQKPAFGDLVRCADPDDASRYVAGRVVGLAGDVVETHGRDLSVNGTRYIGEMACPQVKYTIPHPTSGSTVEINCDQVSIGGHPHYRGSSEQGPAVATPTKTTVGAGMVFLLSDDRSYHDDSRDFGTVPADSCTGRIVFRLWGKEGWADDKRRMTFVQ